MAIVPDMIGFVATDMAKTLAFYRALGLDIPTGNEDEPHVQIITPNGYRLAWDVLTMIKEIDPNWKEPVGQRVGVAFKCDSTAEVDATYHRLVAAGYRGHKEPWDAFWGQRYAQIEDPDGNIVDLFAPLPES